MSNVESGGISVIGAVETGDLVEASLVIELRERGFRIGPTPPHEVPPEDYVGENYINLSGDNAAREAMFKLTRSDEVPEVRALIAAQNGGVGVIDHWLSWAKKYNPNFSPATAAQIKVFAHDRRIELASLKVKM